MYLSRIKLDMTNRHTMTAVSNPNIFHGAIESCENTGEHSRKLWRIDELGGEKYLLILSENKMDFSNVAEQFSNNNFETKNYDTLLDRIKNGTKWRFRLVANPTIKSKGIVKACIVFDSSEENLHYQGNTQKAWFENHAKKNGFLVEPDEWIVTGSRWYSFNKNKDTKMRVKIYEVTFEGNLTVVNSELFKAALINGIGREKAYGCGMITVVGI